MPWLTGAKQVSGKPRQPLPEHSLHPSSSLPSPQSLTLSQTQKRGLQSLFLHINWWVVLHPVVGARESAGRSQEQPGQSQLPEVLPHLDSIELLCTTSRCQGFQWQQVGGPKEYSSENRVSLHCVSLPAWTANKATKLKVRPLDRKGI